MDDPKLHKVLDDIYRYPLRQAAVDTLNRQLRSGVDDATLAETVITMWDEDRLCVAEEQKTKTREPQIICSLGLFKEPGGFMMTVSTSELRPYLSSFDFQGLFVDGLGWDFYRAQPTRIPVDNQEYVLEPVAEKAGFAVYVCDPDGDGHIPDYPVRRKIELHVTKIAYEHLIIFVDAAKTTQIWQWVKREVGKSAACREHTLYTTQTGKALLQRLSNFAFTLQDEFEGIAIKDVTDAVGKALDVEKVTKRFYDRFRKELHAFQKLIEGIDGITAAGDREWYASLMLNRMMFVYFIQKQGFLDRDVDYLRNRLRMVQSKYGSGRFQEFYRDFLVRLFHEGLGQPEPKRKTELHDLLGQVPYLNGGLFDVHDLEQYYTKISIPDKAFERIFDFLMATDGTLMNAPDGKTTK